MNLEGLTPRQREIVDLVLEKKTNVQIAAELYITVSTVEQMLRRVYRTLGVASRKELQDAN